MSEHVATPETYAAWRYLELTDELRPFDGEEAGMLRGKEELALLLAELEKSPTLDNVERFFKRGMELRCFTQRSKARSLEQYRCQNICIADLEARPEAYPDFGTEEEIRQHVAAIRRNRGDLAQLMAEFEEEQHSYADNENLLATLNTLSARRHGLEQDDDESEPEDNQG